MLYHVVLHMNRQALVAAREAVTQVISAEVERATSLQQAGRLIGLWHRADGNGVSWLRSR